MAYTWKQFTDAVKVFLTVDKKRFGIAEAGGFNDMMLRQAVLETQSVIEFYRTGQQNLYTAADFATVGASSSMDLPEGAQVRDIFVLRSKDPTTDLTGSTTANGSTTISGDGTKFLCELAIGDKIKLSSSSTYVTVRSISSDTELTVDTATGDGTTQTIKKQVQFRYPVLLQGWDKREELFAGQVCVNDRNARAVISPQGVLYLYPAIQNLDRDLETHTVELNWDGVKLDFGDNDATPFDEPLVLCVADYVKGQIAKHVERDLSMWAAYLGPQVGSYYTQRRKLYLDCKQRTRLRR